jgi:hypothetical protein
MHSMNKGLATVCLSVLAFLAANAQTVRTLYIDPISNNGPANWNNLSFVGTGTVLLKDSLTNATAVRATVTVPLVGSNANTATSPTGDAEEFTPAGANSVYGNNTKPYGEVVFSNLYANVAYTFTFYASRVGVSDVRTALYTVTGANSGSVTLDAANNSTQVATVSDIYPRADGTLTLRIAEGAGNTPHLYYLTAMKIAYTEPPPTVVYVDSAGTSAATGWNLLPMNDNSDVALAATNGDSSGLRAQVTTPLSSSLSTAGTDNPIGDAAEFAPAGREACYGASDGYMKLYYLKPDVAYTFTFYASRLTYTSQRATRYTVTGLNSASNVLEAAGNTQDVAVVSGILPAADGTVTIHLSRPAGSSYNFLTAFKITYVDNGLPSPEPADIPGKRVLFFGNPYTSTKDAPEIFSRLAGLGGYPRAFVVADTAADRTLANHIARVDQYPGFNVGHPTLTGTNTWDYVVIQGHGDESSALGDATAFRTNALALFRRVKNHASGKGAGAKAVLFQTWARGTGSAVYPGTFASPEAMQAEINANTAVATNNIAVAEGPENVLLAPVGEAFAKGGFDAATLYAANLSDPTNAGPELVALVLYKTLYGGLAMAFEYDAAFSAGVTTLAETNWLRATHWADGLSVPVAQRPPTGSKETLLLDAAGNGANTPVYLGWNYRSFNSLGSVPLVLTNGYPTSATCQVLTRMDAVTTSSTATPTGDAAIFARSLANNVYGHINPFGNSYSNETCEVRFGGLNRNQAYTFTFYASRIGATGRETRYITTGANSAFTDLEPGNNSTQVATVSGIRPKADGTIDLTVTAGPNNTSAEKFYHLNALMIETSRSGLLISVQ